MRNIINMIIKIAIIWGAAWLFPEYVKVQDTRTMVLVVATILIASIILAVIMMGVLILAVLPGNGAGIGIAMLITIIMALASGIIQLMAAVHFVPGFEIHGKLTYIILALLMAVFSIEGKRRHNNVFINERIKQFDEKGIQDRPGGSQDARCTRK